jgi:hypothetical protein
MGIKKIVTETQKCFGMETNATRFDKIKQAKREFRMRNDTEGASFAALYGDYTDLRHGHFNGLRLAVLTARTQEHASGQTPNSGRQLRRRNSPPLG